MGGELHQKGKEAPEPVLGVGAGVVVDTHHSQLRGLLGRSVGFLLTVCIFRIFHIVLFSFGFIASNSFEAHGVPALTPWANSGAAGLVFSCRMFEPPVTPPFPIPIRAF